MKKCVSNSILALVLALAAWMGTSCKSQYELMLASSDVPAKMKMAMTLMESKKFNKAAQMFESMKLLVNGTPQDDSVQYYTAYCNYRYGDATTAQQNYQAFIGTFPRSVFYTQARFEYVDCLYMDTYRWELDQTPTYKALSAINVYINDFPDSEWVEPCLEMAADLEERLDKKDYEAAKLYYTMEDFRAAHYALKNVLKADADNMYREEILYYTCMSAYRYAQNSVSDKQRERYVVFTDDYYDFVGEFPESKHRNHLDMLAGRVQKILSVEAAETNRYQIDVGDVSNVTAQIKAEKDYEEFLKNKNAKKEARKEAKKDRRRERMERKLLKHRAQ